VGAAALIVCAWGTGGRASRLVMPRAPAVLRIVRAAGKRPHALALTEGGHPVHPLYQPGTLRPRELFHVAEREPGTTDDAGLRTIAAALGEEWHA
jgi:hypothetical protein